MMVRLSSVEVEPQRANAGFSLIEMLVAMAIMGIALSVLYQSVSGATRNLRVSNEYSQALALAESTLDTFTAMVSIGKEASGQYGHYEWSAKAAPVESPAGGSTDEGSEDHLGLAQVTVSVTWEDESRRREIVLQSFDRVNEASNES